MPPFRFRLLWMHAIRKRERAWEQTRHIVSALTGKRLRDIIKLSFDHVEKLPEWTREDALELINKWPDIKN